MSRCNDVSYTVSLDSTVSLFMSTLIDALGPYVDMTVDVGTQASTSFPDCTGFARVTATCTPAPSLRSRRPIRT